MAAVEDQPSSKVIFVFADETGKTSEYVSVAAAWILDAYELFRVSQAIGRWQEKSLWSNSEVNFSEFKTHHESALPEYLDVISEQRAFLSFKAISMKRVGLSRSATEIVHRLHEFMLTRGVEHEIYNKRITLPRHIQLTVDEDNSLDAIAIADIESRVKTEFKNSYSDNLVLTSMVSANSARSEMLQLADVIAGAVNRRLSSSDENHKTRMADMIIDRLNIQLTEDDVPDLDATAWLSI